MSIADQIAKKSSCGNVLVDVGPSIQRALYPLELTNVVVYLHKVVNSSRLHPCAYLSSYTSMLFTALSPLRRLLLATTLPDS